MEGSLDGLITRLENVTTRLEALAVDFRKPCGKAEMEEPSNTPDIIVEDINRVREAIQDRIVHQSEKGTQALSSRR